MSAPSSPLRAARAVALLGGAVTALSLAPTAFASSLGGSLNFLGHHVMTDRPVIDGLPFGGLSGLDYDPRDGSYWSISDDRSELGAARFYNVSLDYSLAGFHGLTVNSQRILRQPDGSAFPIRSVDAESIRLDPTSGHLFWASEGDRTGTNVVDPFVREMDSTGAHVREFALPAYYRTSAADGVGTRANFGFESLTFSPDRSMIFAATENALMQDGPAASLSSASPCRIVGFNVATGQMVSEYLYVSNPVLEPPSSPSGASLAGLVEMLAISPTEFITVERSWAAGSSHAIQIFLTSIAGATNFAGSEVIPIGAVAAQKTLLYDLDALGINLMNYEGITFGKTLENGNRSLVLVSDDNFGSTVRTHLLAFEIVPAPGALSLLGLAALAARRRRR